MPKIGRTLSYINTERKGKSTEQSPVSQSLGSSRPGGSVSMPQGDYLLKSIWDKVFEIRTDSQGIEYIFGKLPMVTQYGITMYSGDGVDVPSLASGLPFDGRTIWYNPETNQIEVIGGTGGGSGEGVSNFWDLSGIPSWITKTKPKYSYSEIEGTPDLTKYALVSQIPSLSGYATELWVTKQNYATKATTLSGYGITDAYTKTNVDDLLKSYVTLGGTQTITGEKNFTGGLKVNGNPIYYDTDKKYWKLEGDLLVTGGVTMYGSDSSFTPSTIMDALLYDDATLGINSNGQLYVKGGTSGGDLDITALQNYLTQNSYLNVTEGDNRYLKLSGGTVSGHLTVDGYYFKAKEISGIALELSNAQPYIDFHFNNDTGDFTTRLIEDVKGQLTILGRLVVSNGLDVHNTLRVYDTTIAKWYKVLHEGNYSSYALPLSGGTLTGDLKFQENWGGMSSILRESLFPAHIYRLVWSTNGDVYDHYYNNNYSSSTYTSANLRVKANDGYLTLRFCGDGTFTWNGNKVWHEGNDGIDSGLDADLLDGKHLSDILSSNVASATKLQDNTSFTAWGQTFFINGKPNNIYGTAYFPNGDLIYAKDEGGTSQYILGFTSSLGLGYGSAGAGYDTYILGNNIHFRYSTSRITGLTLNSSGNVGIGTPNPSQKLHVKNGNITCDGGFVQSYRTNNPNSSGAYMRLTSYYPEGDMTWDAIIASDYYGNHLCTTGGFTHGMYFKSGRYGYDNFIFLDSLGNPVARLSTSSGGGNHHFVGNMLVTGGITMYSDQCKKTILNHVELSLKDIANAPLIEHYYNSDEKKTTHVGSIAQYWASMNDWFCKLDSEGYYTMEIQNAALASAISIARELDRYETKTDKAIKKLKKRICELEEEVERLKAS